ncbi:acyl carrier protein, partial [Streptomyces sp. 8P21H-1]
RAGRAPADGADALSTRLAGVGAADRQAILLDLVRQEAAHVLGHSSAGRIGHGAAFTDVGFDSLTVIELRDRLLARTGLRLPATFAFDFPTPVTLADHLNALLDPGTAEDPLLDELARLEDLVAARPADRAKDTVAAARLRVLAARLSTVAPGPADGTDSIQTTLDTASVDDVLAFIDEEFGIAGPSDPSRAHE